jgi:hypothetical protein
MKRTMTQFPLTLAPLLERAGKLFPNLPWIVQCLAYLSLCRQVARWHREARFRRSTGNSHLESQESS